MLSLLVKRIIQMQMTIRPIKEKFSPPFDTEGGFPSPIRPCVADHPDEFSKWKFKTDSNLREPVVTG